jgi:dienelactone hydrolase
LGTEAGQIIGTACYLSPEQAEGFPVDARSDVFSFGVVLYEMLTGEKPFDRGSLAGTLSSILRDTPPSVRKFSPATPRDLARLVERCIDKNRDKRFRTAAEVQDALLACLARLRSPRYRVGRILRRKKVLVPVVLLLTAVAAGVAFWGERWMRVRNARKVIEPQIARLLDQHLYNAADELVRRIEPVVPDDAPVREFRRDYRLVSSVVTTPPGAEVAIKDYATPNEPWRVLGRAPLPNATIPLGYFRWRVTAPGYRTREFAETGILQPVINFTLYPDAGSPPDMVLIPAGGSSVKVPEFWLDRYEVTNRQYLEFVKVGSYRRREFWQEPFVLNGVTITWEQAMESFRDQTGRPGPAAWELETYPDGKAEFPVTGVSWYEAAAYARFAGKSLPTWSHWRRAARSEGLYADPVLASNFAGNGLAAVGSFQAMDRYGTYDLAGNAKEWIWNEAAPGMRLAVGGAWDEAYYASAEPDVAPPMERRPNIGFRCAKYNAPPAEEFTARVKLGTGRDLSRVKPVDDVTFTQFKKLYDYPPSPLRASVDGTDETDRYWRKERVSFDAAYDNQRVTAYLMIPRGAAPPYQTVVYCPSGIAFSEKSSSRLEMWYLSPLIRSGRAVLYPVLWGTYERREQTSGSNAEKFRLRTIREIQDLRRSLDYLDTRADIDQRKLAFFGFSAGAVISPVALAVEPRFHAAILAVGGLIATETPPETDPLNFASRAKTPVLMMNGRYDNRFPLEASGRPLMNLFGAPPADKKLVLLETGHAMVGFPASTRESLAWLDRYLGPVH